MGKNGKPKKKAKKPKKRQPPATVRWDPDEIPEDAPPDYPDRVRAYSRLMGVEERLYQIWEQRSRGEMNWIGEALRDLVDEDSTLWIAAVGDKVAALGGHLELNAVFPDQTITLLHEPGLHTREADDALQDDTNDDDHPR